jgi:hypothetical protein
MNAKSSDIIKSSIETIIKTHTCSNSDMRQII